MKAIRFTEGQYRELLKKRPEGIATATSATPATHTPRPSKTSDIRTAAGDIGFATVATLKPSKYHSVRTVVDGIEFASGKEAARYQELKVLEQAGEISGLRRQVAFSLHVGGQHVGKYVCDFCYWQRGVRVVEDAKGAATETYRIKKALMLAVHNIEVKET